jgi:hypothetical protein
MTWLNPSCSLLFFRAFLDLLYKIRERELKRERGKTRPDQSGQIAYLTGPQGQPLAVKSYLIVSVVV